MQELDAWKGFVDSMEASKRKTRSQQAGVERTGCNCDFVALPIFAAIT
jgi:hypothetical protein